MNKHKKNQIESQYLQDIKQTPVLRVTGLRKQFQDHVALDGIDFSIEPGQIVAIIGPSGAGKTTLLRCIALLALPDAGKIELFGTTVFDANLSGCDGRETDLRIKHQQVLARTGVVFQSLNLWPHRTVLQNVSDPLARIKRIPRKVAENQAAIQLDELGLAGKHSRHPDSLSGGEKQRVALARALVNKPDILLLDEITSALDLELVADLLALLRSLVKSAITFIIVTHELSFATEVCQQVIFMENGKLIESGPPNIVLTSPRTQRVKEFIRKVNGEFHNIHNSGR